MSKPKIESTVTQERRDGGLSISTYYLVVAYVDGRGVRQTFPTRRKAERFAKSRRRILRVLAAQDAAIRRRQHDARKTTYTI